MARKAQIHRGGGTDHRHELIAAEKVAHLDEVDIQCAQRGQRRGKRIQCELQVRRIIVVGRIAVQHRPGEDQPRERAAAAAIGFTHESQFARAGLAATHVTQARDAGGEVGLQCRLVGEGMGVHIPEARHQVLALAVDHPRRGVDIRQFLANAGNTPVAKQHVTVRLRCIGQTIDDRDVCHERCRRRRRKRGKREQQGQ
jgi:hypothetical protein